MAVRYHRSAVALVVATLMVGSVSSALPARADAVADPRLASPSQLPFDRPSLASLHASPRKAFAHIVPNFPVSIDNKDASADYYTLQYQNPNGEGGKYAAYGGLIRDRPLTRPVRDATTDWALLDLEDEIGQASSEGLDGFSVDLLVTPGTSNTRLLTAQSNLFKAAPLVDPDFKIMLQPDMTAGFKTLDQQPFADYIAQLAAYPSAYRLADGRLVLSPFKSEVRPADWWQGLISLLHTSYGIDVAFLPTFLDERPTLSQFTPFSYGISNWGNRSPTGNVVGTPNPRITNVHAAQDVWMQPISTQDERPNQHLYTEAQNTQNLRNTWQIAIDNGAELVNMPTWNDYAEGSQMAPTAQNGWTYLDLSEYYLTWWKTGTAPPITHDQVYLTHRSQAVAAAPTFQETSPMTLAAGSSPGRDTVEALTFLTAPATVTVHVGDAAYQYQAPAGVTAVTEPLGVGNVSVSVMRSGVAVAVAATSFPVTSAPYVQDLHYVAATGSPGAPDTSAPGAPGAPTATAATGNVTVTWGAATDDVAVDHYEVHRSKLADFTPTAATLRALRTGLSWTDTPSPGAYFYKVIAVDASGKTSVPSAQATAFLAGTPVDTDGPSTPTDGTATSGDTTVALAWTGSVDDTAVGGYDVHRSSSAVFTPSDATRVATVTDTSYVDSPGSGTWYYRIVANDTLGHPSLPSDPFSGTVVDTTPPSQPGTPVATFAEPGVALTWTAATDDVGVTGYQVYRDGVLLGTSSSASYEDATATVGSHDYTVIAQDAAGLSGPVSGTGTFVVPDTTAPSQPGVPSASVSADQVSLSWDPAIDDIGVTSYEVYRSTTPGAPPALANLVGTTSDPSFVDTAPAGTFSYLVVAVDAAGNDSLTSEEGTATVVDDVAPTAPGTPVATVAAGSVTLSWTAATDQFGVTGYDVHRASDSDFSDDTVVSSVPATSDTDAPGPGTWFYRVVAHDASGNASGPSESVSATVDPPDSTPPTVPSDVAAAASNGTVTVTWSASTDESGIASYEVSRNGTVLGTVTGLTYTDAPGVGHWTYTVIATDGTGNRSDASSAAAADVLDTTPPTAPGTPSATVTASSVALTWDVASDDVAVTGYRVYRGASLVGSPSSASYTETSVPVGAWTYTVVAVDAAGNASAASSGTIITVLDTTPPTTPGTPTATSNAGLVSLSWTGSTDDVGVTGYELHRSLTSGFTPSAGTWVKSLTATSTTDNPAEGTWYYRVVARDAAGNGTTSGQASVNVVFPDTTAPTTPTGVTAVVSGSTVTVGWNASTDASNALTYALHRSSTSGFSPSSSTFVRSTTGTSVTDTPGPGTWYYRIVATDPSSNSSAASIQATATIGQPPPPTVTTLTPTSDTYADSSAATTTKGTSTSLLSRGSPGAAAYFRFALPAAPAGQVLASAVLTVRTTTDTSAPSTDAHPVKIASNSWDESTLTWSNKPAISSTLLGTLSGASKVNTPYSTTLSTSVLSPLLGTPQSFAMMGSGTDGLYVNAVNSSTAANRPQLVLTFTSNGTPPPADTAAPTPPGTPTGSVAAQTVSLSWAASTDGTGVTGYEMHRSSAVFTPSSATLVKTVSGTSTTDTPGVGTWHYRVVAKDAAGNASAPSAETVVTVAATTPPTSTTVTVVPTADATANSAAATTNNGTSTSLLSKGSPASSAYLRFVIPVAPAGKTLTKAVLRLHTSTDSTAGSADKHAIKVAGDGWTETGLTWNNHPAITSTLLGTVTGATAANHSYDTILTVSVVSPLIGKTTSWAITGSSSDSLYFWSRTLSTTASRPQLILTYS